jgi:hypothetical protein
MGVKALALSVLAESKSAPRRLPLGTLAGTVHRTLAERTPVPGVTPVVGGENPPQCGSLQCAGCYEVEPGVRVHPPKSGPEWREWLLKWEPKGKIQ